jgi:hypothetical protein
MAPCRHVVGRARIAARRCRGSTRLGDVAGNQRRGACAQRRESPEGRSDRLLLVRPEMPAHARVGRRHRRPRMPGFRIRPGIDREGCGGSDGCIEPGAGCPRLSAKMMLTPPPFLRPRPLLVIRGVEQPPATHLCRHDDVSEVIRGMAHLIRSAANQLRLPKDAHRRGFSLWILDMVGKGRPYSVAA